MNPLLQRADSLIDLGRSTEAVTLLQQALAENPDDATTHLLLARALVDLDRDAEGLAAAERACALAPDSELPHRLRAVALSSLGRHGEAVDAANRAVALEPTAWQPHVQYALSASHFPGLLRDAHTAARRSVELGPFAADTHFAVGFVSDRLRLHEESDAAYRRALELDPTHAAAHNNLATRGGLRHALGDRMDGYAQALRHDPGMSVAQRNVEQLALIATRRLYFGAVAGLLVCLFASLAGPGSAVFRAVVGVLMLTAMAVWTVLLVRRVPPGIRVFVRHRMTHDAFMVCTLALTLVTLLAACAAAFLPLPEGAAAVLLRPIGLLNVALVVWGVVRSRS